MNTISSNKLITVVQNSMFVAISLITALIIKIPVIPVAPFLKLDISDIPILIVTLISGIPSGLTVLFSVTVIRSMIFSTAGWIGFIVRITSSILVISMGYFCRNKNNTHFKNFIGILIGIILCTLIKIPLNYIFWIYFFNIPKVYIQSLIFTVIIPFNIFKSLINCIMALYLFKPIEGILKKIQGHISA